MTTYRISAKAVPQGVYVHLMNVTANTAKDAVNKARRKWPQYKALPFWQAVVIQNRSGRGLGKQWQFNLEVSK